MCWRRGWSRQWATAVSASTPTGEHRRTGSGLGRVGRLRAGRHHRADRGDDRRPARRSPPADPAAHARHHHDRGPDRARVAGFAIHLAIGQIFALFYAAGFTVLDRSGWWLGALFGLAHATI